MDFKERRSIAIILHNPSEALAAGLRTCPCPLCQWGMDLEAMWGLRNDDDDTRLV